MVFSKIIPHSLHDERMLLEKFRENIGIEQNGQGQLRERQSVGSGTGNSGDSVRVAWDDDENSAISVRSTLGGTSADAQQVRFGDQAVYAEVRARPHGGLSKSAVTRCGVSKLYLSIDANPSIRLTNEFLMVIHNPSHMNPQNSRASPHNRIHREYVESVSNRVESILPRSLVA